MKHIGDLVVTKDNLEQVKNIEKVTGWLDIQADGASLPALQTTGWLYIRADGASLPALQTVTGWLDIRAEGASLPALQTVTGGLYIQAEGASLPAVDKSIKINYRQPVPIVCPIIGEFEAWKRCADGVIVRLLVPADAKRSSAETRKCRADYVKTLEVIGADVGVSIRDGVTKYRAGEITRALKWNKCRWVECGGGIHFFMTREEAEAYS